MMPSRWRRRPRTVTVVVEFDTHDATEGFLPSLTHVARGASARVEDVEECG